MSKYRCKNDSSRPYTGQEPSPKGLGYCAHAENTGVTMKGRDGSLWKVKEDKNGTKRWYKVTPKVRRPPQFPKIRKLVHVFYNDKKDSQYTYLREVTTNDVPEVKKAILRAMKGFTNVMVKHVEGNEYELWTDGPDKHTSDEMRNLAQMGEFTKFTVKMAPGFDFSV